MRDRAGMAAEKGDLVLLEVHRVHRDQPGPEQAQTPQPFDRTHAVLLQGTLHFVLRLVQVDVHRKV